VVVGGGQLIGGTSYRGSRMIGEEGASVVMGVVVVVSSAGLIRWCCDGGVTGAQAPLVIRLVGP